MQFNTRSRLGLGATAAVALTMALTNSAHADYAPSPSDAVGVGSDTVQNISNFINDGDNKGDAGYNSAGNVNRVVSFDATPDANDRVGYKNASTTLLDATVTLRAGQSPVYRPNGSGDGASALCNLPAGNTVDFARTSSIFNYGKCTGATVPDVHAYRIAADDLVVAVGGDATGTVINSFAPTAGLTPGQLNQIYSCALTDWSNVPGNTTGAAVGTTANPIIPLLPQSSSGTGSTFLKDIGIGTPGSCVKTVEENDPAALASDAGTTNAKNKLVPFSSGRKKLFDQGCVAATATTPASCPTKGYFYTPNKTYASSAPVRSNIFLLYGSQTPGACAVSGNIAAPAGLTAATSATGGSIPAGQVYYYKITATNANGETTGSNEATVTAGAGTTNSNTLTWTATTGATGYNIYRATASGAENVSPALIGTVTSGATTTFTDTGAAATAGAVPSFNSTASSPECNTRNLYVNVLQSALNATTKFQPGGTTNLVQELFAPGGYVATFGGPLIAAAGATAKYGDCGIVPHTGTTNTSTSLTCV